MAVLLHNNVQYFMVLVAMENDLLYDWYIGQASTYRAAVTASKTSLGTGLLTNYNLSCQ